MKLNPWRDDRSDFAIVLDALYENEITSEPKTGFVSPDEFVDLIETGKTVANLDVDDQVFEELEKLGYVDLGESGIDPHLTAIGYEFAHQLKTERQSQRRNTILIIFTILQAASILAAKVPVSALLGLV